MLGIGDDFSELKLKELDKLVGHSTGRGTRPVRRNNECAHVRHIARTLARGTLTLRVRGHLAQVALMRWLGLFFESNDSVAFECLQPGNVQNPSDVYLNEAQLGVSFALEFENKDFFVKIENFVLELSCRTLDRNHDGTLA